jgi:hypothetical protein
MAQALAIAVFAQSAKRYSGAPATRKDHPWGLGVARRVGRRPARWATARGFAATKDGWKER